jgi:hypothetical protein
MQKKVTINQTTQTVTNERLWESGLIIMFL